MIQRIQSLYLLLTTVLSAVFLNGHILRFAEGPRNSVYIGSEGLSITGNTGGPEILWIIIGLTVVVILIFLISLASIFLFKRRNIQMKLSGACIALVSLLALSSVAYFILVKINYDGRILPGMNVLIIPLMLLFSILAYRGIKKDEMLVKSLDRIR